MKNKYLSFKENKGEKRNFKFIVTFKEYYLNSVEINAYFKSTI